MANASALPRGVRNNNPGNIRRTKEMWEGLAEVQSDFAFFTFTAPEWGIRAIMLTLVTYQDKHELLTVNDMIHRWAPSIENNTEAYINAVCASMGTTPHARIDMHSRAVAIVITDAIIRQECGYEYPAEVMGKAADMANIR